jgi:uncharacterized protein with NRDE domain
MCLLGIVYRALPECPLLIAANREEAYARPAAPPALRPGPDGAAGPLWLGGIDLAAGGTWLGVNQHGLLVAITNRPRRNVPREPRSRGLLCRESLAFQSAAEALAAARDSLRQQAYAGFNLVVADARAGFVLEAGDDVAVHALAPGINLIANGAFNDPQDARMRRVRSILAEQAGRPWREWVRSSERLCGLHAADGPAICLHGDGKGTVSSSIIALPDDLRDGVYLHAAGSPCRTPYQDYSDLLRLLTAPAFEIPSSD